MSVSIVATPDLSGYTFYRNKEFDISFSLVNTLGVDTSFYFSNSSYGPRAYASDGHFASSTGIPSVGPFGTLVVDVLSSNARVVSTVTPRSYLGTVGVCTDPSGNVYFAHANGNRIYKIDLSGEITTFAGTGIAGDTEGPRLTAQFRAPAFVITDGSGTFYVTDQWRVRKIDSNGEVSTVAGTFANRGYVDGTGTAAQFWTPAAIVLRPTGGLLVTDNDYHTVRNVTLPDGVVTTYAGVPEIAGYLDGSTSSIVPSSFLATSVSGDVLERSGSSWSIAASPGTVRLTAIDTSGSVRLYAGLSNSTYGGPIVYQTGPTGVLAGATGLGNVTRVNRIASSGSRLVGAGSSNTGDRALYTSTDLSSWSVLSTGVLNTGFSVAQAGGTWLAVGTPGLGNSGCNVARSTNGTTWSSILTNPLSPNTVGDIAYGNSTWVYTGDSVGSFDTAYSTDDGLTWTGVANFPRIGGIFRTGTKVAYGNSKWVIGGIGTSTAPSLRYSSDGIAWTDCTVSTSFSNVTALYYSSNASTWYAAASNVLAQSSDGIAWTLSSVPFEPTSFGEPPAYVVPSTGRLFFPGGLLYDPSGTLYIADQYNNRIRTVPVGTTTLATFAGSGVDTISNGTLATAAMARPGSLARDPNGTIYVGSFERSTIQTITGNTVSLLTGAQFGAGYEDGPLLTARFNGVAGMSVFGDNLYVGEVYNADVRNIKRLPDLRPGLAPPGYRVIATSNYPITVSTRIDPSWTSVGGQLPLYKYEPFCNTFTTKLAGDTLGYSPSSTELIGYLTGTGTTNVAFRGPNGANTAYSYPLVLSVQCLSGTTVVDDISTSVTINAARLIVTPCNASLVFYRNEPISPVTFSIVAASASQIYAASTLPNGLTLTSSASNSYTLRGTPAIQSLASNYTILGQDTSGRTYSTVVSIGVNPERLILDVSGSTSFGNVVSTSPVTPVTLTARFPPYGSVRAMRYTWSEAPPAGLQFRDICGNALTGLSYGIQAADSSFSLTLAGTITEAQVRAYAAAGKRTTSLSIVGTRTAPLPSLTPSLPTTLTFTMGQVILFDPSVSTPFVGIRTLNWSYFAKSYFGTDVSISSIVVTDGFLPDGLTGSFTSNLQRFDVCGTPTTLSSYFFTLTATAGSQTAELPVSMTTVPDSVFITTPVDTCFNFIQYRDLSNAKSGYYSSNLDYQVRATSGCNATLTASGLPDGVTLDLSLGRYRLNGRPTTATGLSTATLTAAVAASGVTSNTTFRYSVSADFFTFDPPGGAFTFAQNVLSTPTQVTATTFSENPIVRYSSGDLPSGLTITNTGLITGTPQGSVDSSFTITAFTAYSSGAKPYTYILTDDAVLLQPAVYTTRTAPGGNVSIPITGYSLSALTVSNYRFSNAFAYGLSINPTTGLLSGTLASTLPDTVSFKLLGSAGIVDGSLSGTMTTANLTVNRAQLLANQNGSLAVFSSDTNGSNWTQVVSKGGTFAYQIGTNGSNVYMIPTSAGQILRSSDGASYTSNVTLGTGSDPRLTAVVNKPGTSTWWVGGTLSNGLGRTVTVFKTTDDGLTWDAGTSVTTNGFTDRAGNPASYPTSNQAYLNGGVELAYKSGVLLLGGNQILRSADEGVTWTDASSGLIEISSFSVDHETVWLAAGTSYYLTRQFRSFTPNLQANTLKYSTDAGLTWSDVTTGGFSMIAYQIQYGHGVWLASGFDRNGNSSAIGSVRYSFDGLTWTTLSSVPTVSLAFSGNVSLPSGPLGTYPMALDETEWKVFRVPGDGFVTLYTHQYDLPVDTAWTSMDMTTPLSGVPASRYYSYVAQTIDPGADVTTITFPLPNTGPTFISPAQSTYVVWQYMPLPTITFTAAGSGIVYFVSELPVGLVWNSATHSVSGAPMRTGTQTFTVYAKNSGITAFTVTLIVEVPRIVKRQTGAGAYTSLLRQYTEVNAAQSARDSHVLPTESRTLGEFASPYPPSVITPSNCPC